MGKYSHVMEPGLNLLLPVVDRVKYVQNMKEQAIDIPQQSAITAGERSLCSVPAAGERSPCPVSVRNIESLCLETVYHLPRKTYYPEMVYRLSRNICHFVRNSVLTLYDFVGNSRRLCPQEYVSLPTAVSISITLNYSQMYRPQRQSPCS